MGDSDPNAERPSNFYDSPYLTEYYDLWVEEHKKTLKTQDDALIYLAALKRDLVRERQLSQDNPFTILDIGTGTGRVLVNLANDAVHAGIDLSNVELIGVDNEPAMIKRSQEVEKETESMTHVAKVIWALGEAVSLTSVPALKNRLGRVDSLIFAVGSISHLISPEEPQLFMSQVATLLTPKSGRAYLPIQNDLISRRLFTTVADSDTTWAELNVAKDFPSKLYPGIIYKQYPIEKSVTDGPIKTDHYRFHVIRKTDSGDEEVIEKNNITIGLRIWDEGEFLQWAKNAGLHCSEVCYSAHETYYVFKLSDSGESPPDLKEIPQKSISSAVLFS
jgi:SAM-dependent methyltransferase